MTGRTDTSVLRAALADPLDVCRQLGIDVRAKRQGGGLLIACPAPGHDDRGPSCSVTRGPDRTLRVRCFGCELAGDVFTLIAAVRGLDVRTDFAEVARIAGELAGIDVERTAIESALRAPPPLATPPKPPPPEEEVLAFWQRCAPCSADAGVAGWLRSRGLEPAAVAQLDLARALPAGAACPRWAAYRGDADAARPWSELGYRAIVPMFDAAGDLRSVRARYIGDGSPDAKALPPSGWGTRGLVMACPVASLVLAVSGWPWWAERRIVIAEGEPDFLTWATRPPLPRTFGVLGLGGAGQWTDEIAARIPDGAEVILRTDADDAGDAYASEIALSLRGRCSVLETDAAGRAERRRARAARDADRRHARDRQVAFPGVPR